MMTASEFAKIALSFTTVRTFYAKGGYGQQCNTLAQYNVLCKQYAWNEAHRNNANLGARPFDCVCFCPKGILWGARPEVYPKYASNGVPDMTDQAVGNSLTECVKPSEAKEGYILWKQGHVGVALGDGRWIDANYTSTQNGVQLHTTGIETFTKAGKFPYIDYSEQSSGGSDTDEVKDFLNWLYNEYKKGGKL